MILRPYLWPSGPTPELTRRRESKPYAAPSKLRNTLPPLAYNDLFGIVYELFFRFGDNHVNYHGEPASHKNAPEPTIPKQ